MPTRMVTAALAVSLLVPGAAQAAYFDVYVLRTPSQPERKLCSSVDAATPQQGMARCLQRFGVGIKDYNVAATGWCDPNRSTHRTVQRNGARMWEYDTRWDSPDNGC